MVKELETEVGAVARAGRELQQAEEASLGDDQVRETVRKFFFYWKGGLK